MNKKERAKNEAIKHLTQGINNPGDNINMLMIDLLIPYSNHPFKLYEGERFSDMVESIKVNGVITPIIVRPIDSHDEQYEILSGHNRVEAAKAAGLEIVPALIREDLSEDEALLVVTETNLIQRSFAALSHSERAAALTVHYDAVKNQNKRTALINEINELLNADNTDEINAFGLLDQKASSREITAGKYGLAPRSVGRYIRLNKLHKSLLDRVDKEEIGYIPPCRFLTSCLMSKRN